MTKGEIPFASLLLLVASVSCDDDSEATGATGSGGSAGTAPTCDVAAPFSTPEPIGGVNTAGMDWCPRLSANQLELYVTMDSATTSDLFRFERASTGDAFAGPGTPLTGLNTSGFDDCAFLSGDGLEIFYGSRSGQSDLYLATRASPDAEFANPQPLANVNTAENEWYPWVSGDELFFVATRGGVTSIHKATRAPEGSFGPGAPVSELHEEGASEFGPTLTGDGLTLYFNRDKPGENEIWRASRATREATFDDIAKVGELNTASYEAPGWVSADGCTLYLDSNRGGDWDIYRATKP